MNIQIGDTFDTPRTILTITGITNNIYVYKCKYKIDGRVAYTSAMKSQFEELYKKYKWTHTSINILPEELFTI